MRYKLIQNWQINISEQKPEICCISAPYIVEQILKEISNSSYDLMNCTHSDHHHGHSSLTRIKFKNTLKIIEEFNEHHIYVTQKGLKFRKENNGLVIANGRNVFFVNKKGSHFLKLLGSHVIVSDIRRICEELNIPEQTGLQFFKKFVFFGLFKLIQ